jgi:hypothetical protein
MKQKLMQNKILFWLGTIHLFIFWLLLIYSFFNTTEVLGVNSMYKPMKFALSIWIYSWTIGLILNYVADVHKVKIYSRVAVVCMCFEQAAITFQAANGTISHFNRNNNFGIILYSLMGIFILTVTLWTAYMAYIFIKQKDYNLQSALVLSIKIALIFFIIFSLFGGYISGLQGHTVGSIDGGEGLWFLNWSKLFGDLRVAHFFGIHSLQVIPVFAIVVIKILNDKQAVKAVKIFSMTYLAFILFTLIQSSLGNPLIK